MCVVEQVADAKKHLITVPLTRSFSFPHKFDGIFGAAKVMLRPASEGTGVIAGAPLHSSTGVPNLHPRDVQPEKSTKHCLEGHLKP